MNIQNIHTHQKLMTILVLVVFTTHVSFFSQAQFGTPSPLPKPAQMVTDNYNNARQVGYCLSQAGSNSCTANDFTITSIRTLNVDDGCSSPTDYMQIDLQVTFGKQVPARYDVGAWFYRGIQAGAGLNFNNQNAINGSFCTRVGVQAGLTVPGTTTLSSLIPANDGSCIDVPSGTPGNLSAQRLNNIILPCREISVPADGIVDISACTSWSNNSGANCAGPQYREFNANLTWPNSPFATEIQPNTGSKCNCAEFNGGPILVGIPNISVTKSCTPKILPPGATTTCTINITNTGTGIMKGATALNTAGFFYEDDYPENQGTIGTITKTPNSISVVDGFTKTTSASNTTNRSLNIYPGDIAANGGTVQVVYQFITNPALPTTFTTITNTVCANYYNNNATVGNLTDDAVFQYTSTEPGQCATDVVTTPVSIASFHAKESNVGGYDISWSTSTETGNLGFNIYAIVGETKYQLNKNLIPSNVIDSMKTEVYNYHLDSQLFGYIDQFVIEDVDRFGRRHSNGVYTLNKKYGYLEQAQDVQKTNWADINIQHNEKTIEQQNKLSSQFNSQKTIDQTNLQSTQSNANLITIDMQVQKSGIYRVSHVDLANLGVSLDNLKVENINVSYLDEIIPVDFVLGKCDRKEFCQGSYLQFYAQSNETLYSDKNIYVLNLFSNIGSPHITSKNANPSGRTEAESYEKTVKINRNLNYSYGSPLESEPWFDTNIFANQVPKIVTYDMQLNDLYTNNSSAKIKFEYWGGLDFPNDDNDHTINFAINGQALGSDSFDGIVARNSSYSINSNQLQLNNVIELELPATNISKLDIISLESIALTYPAQFIAQNNQINFKYNNVRENFSVSGFNHKSIQVFVKSGSNIIKLNKFKSYNENNNFQVLFSGINGFNEYYLTTDNSVFKPELKFSQTDLIDIESTEHLIISHSDFIGPELENYASNTRRNYRIVNVDDIYNIYSNKIPDGEAIKEFIKDTASIGGLESVLLVGGDNYDYKNYLGLDAISFVPTIYRETDDLIKYSAVDALFGDTNNDNIPDVPVGRFPVRTLSELSLILNKSIQYNSGSYTPSVVLVADNTDTYDAYNFNESSDAIADQFSNVDWSVEKSYLDNMPFDTARNLLIDEMNSGVRLAMYTGHSSSKRWAFEGIFKNSDVNNLTNANNPFGVIQWGCWNTYFVEPEEDSLGHAFMLSGNKGAAFVIGASTLTNAGEESRFSSLFNIYMLAEDLTIGEAMMQAKYEYNQESSQLHKDILWGISLLGDPLIKLN